MHDTTGTTVQAVWLCKNNTNLLTNQIQDIYRVVVLNILYNNVNKLMDQKVK